MKIFFYDKMEVIFPYSEHWEKEMYDNNFPIVFMERLQFSNYIGTFLLKFIELNLDNRDEVKELLGESGINIDDIEHLKTVQQTFKYGMQFCLDLNFDYDFNGMNIKNLQPIKRWYILQLMPKNQTLEHYSKNLKVSYKILPGSFDILSKKPITERDFLLVESFESQDIGSICYSIFKEMVSRETHIKNCPHCNKYFIVTSRIDVEYCDNCKDIGPVKKYQEKIKNDDYLSAFQSEYKYRHAKLRKITNPVRYEEEKKSLKKWRIEARKRAENKEILLDKYIEWLKK